MKPEASATRVTTTWPPTTATVATPVLFESAVKKIASKSTSLAFKSIRMFASSTVTALAICSRVGTSSTGVILRSNDLVSTYSPSVTFRSILTTPFALGAEETTSVSPTTVTFAFAVSFEIAPYVRFTLSISVALNVKLKSVKSSAFVWFAIGVRIGASLTCTTTKFTVAIELLRSPSLT